MSIVLERIRLDNQGRILLPKAMRSEDCVALYITAKDDTHGFDGVCVSKLTSKSIQHIPADYLVKSKVDEKGRAIISSKFRKFLPEGELDVLYFGDDSILLKAHPI